MFGKRRVAWKLSGLFSIIILLVVVGTSYLSRLDDTYWTAVAAGVAALLSFGLSWWAFQRLVGVRIRALREGIRRIRNFEYQFRFNDPGEDEFAELASSFNEMTDQLSSTMTKLKRTREYLEGIVENSADIIITVDVEGLIKTFNAGAEKILGYARDEVIGKRIEMLFADPSERDAAIEQLEFSDHVVNYETHFLTKEGRVRDVILTLSRLRRSDGTPVGTFGISKDVTREKRLQRQLLQSERMAALGQALTGIQHSVKNLLNVLKGGSYMVKTGLAKEDRQLLNEGWEMVQDGIDHMTELSTNMLKFAKERKLNLVRNDLVEMARRVHTLSDNRFRERGVTLKLDLEDDIPYVLCDRELIHTVLMDLLTNARDACAWKDYPDGERPQVLLKVQLSSLENYVLLEVSDNGEGMSEQVRAKIFTPFFSTKKKKGTGMGLALASRVVSSHGGRISILSEPGKGATFQVMLPMNGPNQGERLDDVEESPGR